MNAIRHDDFDLRGLEIKDETGGEQGQGGTGGETDVAAAVERLQTGFDTKMAEVTRDLKAANDRADALEVKMNRPGGHLIGLGAKPELTLEQKAFLSYVRAGADYVPAEERKALRVADNQAGGFFVPPEWSAELIKNLVQISPVRAAARVGTMSSSSIYIPKRLQSVAAQWVGEIEERGETQPKYGQIEIAAHEASAIVPVSNQLLEDAAIDIGAELASDFAEEFGRLEGQSFIIGNGVKKPLGLLMTNALLSTGVSFAAPATLGDALLTLMYSVPVYYRSRSSWMMSGPTVARIRGLKDSTGRYLWQESLAEGQPPTLLGRPVVEAPDMPDFAVGNTPILFGDFGSGYRIYDRVGVSILRDPFSLAHRGLTRFIARMRVGAAPVQTEAYRGLTVTA